MPNTNFGNLESTETPKQHTISNIGKIANIAKNATLEGVGNLDGTLEPRPYREGNFPLTGKPYPPRSAEYKPRE